MIGETVGQYRIVEEIGSGGMGTVYRAKQVSLGRDVALKVMLPHHALDPVNLERFKREGEAVARVAHPNVIQILDIGEENGRYFIAMEFVDGPTVSEAIHRDGPYSFRDAAVICSQVASALGAIHEAGVVHRDVKPSNIIVQKGPFAKLGDFGVAGLTDQSDEERLTMTRAAVGTPYYMSPEQVKGRDALDGASDVYSVGVVLYEMLAGEHPFGDATPTEAMMQQCSEPFPPIRRYRGDIPDILEAVLDRCLAKDKSERYADGSELHAALEKARLHIEMNAMRDDSPTDDYKARVTGTGFFYTDSVQLDDARRVGRFRALMSEVVAQVRDANRSKRRALGRMYVACMASRDSYKGLERELAELGKRRKYHEEKAEKFKQEAQGLIERGDADGAESKAEQEARHQQLALDYGLQADELGKQVHSSRDEYDRLRKQHSEAADELALLDAEARRSGRCVPLSQKDPKLAKQARAVRRGLLVALCCLLFLGLCGAGVLVKRWLARPKPLRPVVPVAPPVPAPAPAPVPVVPSQKGRGLVLHYTFNKDSGGKVLDSSGNSNHGYTVGSVNYEESFSGVAPRLTSCRTYIVCDSPGLNMDGWDGFSASIWVRLMGNGSRNAVLSKGGISSQGRGGCWMTFGGAFGGARTRNHSGACGVFTSEKEYERVLPAALAHRTTSELGRWYHLAATYDGVVFRFYIDGKEAGASTNATGRSRIYDMPGTKLVIGNPSRPPQMNWPDYFFKGQLDELRIYDRALTADEVAARFREDKGQTRSELLLHYDFDSDDGTRITDKSGNGHHAKARGGEWVAQGRTGGGYELDGVDDYIDLGGNALNDVRTISLWFKLAGDVGPRLDHCIALVGRNASGEHDEVGLVFLQAEHAEAGKLTFGRRVGRATHPIYSDGNTWAGGKWHHVACVLDRNDGMKMYVDGILQKDTDPSTQPVQARNEMAALGRWGDLMRWAFRGCIDEVRFYSRGLTGKEVRSLFVEDSGRERSIRDGLALYYGFDKEEAGQVTDGSGRGKHGTVHGAEWTRHGKKGGAYSFDGVNDYIMTQRALPNVSDMTIAAWIKPRRIKGPEGARTIYVQCPNPNFVDVTHGLSFYYREESKICYTAGFQPQWNFITSEKAVSSNKWTFVAVTRKNNTVTHFINGHESGKGRVRDYSGRAKGDAAVVGARAHSGGMHQFFDGLIDELIIYDRALSSAEIAKLCTSGLPKGL